VLYDKPASFLKGSSERRNLYMILLLLTLALILPLLAAMALAALALLDLFKRDATPFLAPALVSFPGGENQCMPAGVWQVYFLAATYRASSSGSEGCAWL
jgi:hypothetical protein